MINRSFSSLPEDSEISEVRPAISRFAGRTTVAMLVGLTMLAASSTWAADAEKLVLKPGQHISFIGNTLPDRMQHDGWLEATLNARFPNANLVVRNLGFSGDELNLRLRSLNFGSPDEHLTKNQTDVIFAFFGYNESFAGKEGLDAFKKDLADFIAHTSGQKYNGQTAPKLVLFSPIAHENLNDPNLPDGKENNERIALYTQAMKEVAEATGTRFVDLFHPTLKLYEENREPLTINGVHLTTLGNRLVASVIESALLGTPDQPTDEGLLNQIRQAVLDKNFYWYNRYRTVDGYSIYGGRADLKFVDGQTNRVVMDREMEVLDVMTANRDKRIWAVAQGGDLAVDDSNTPPFIPVISNKPGKGPNGEHIFLTGAEELETMTVHDDMEVSLFASEEQFPELINPVQMAFDTKGRLWAAVWPTYPHWKPKEEMNDKLLIFEDKDGDGKADSCKTFVDDLHNPTGFEFWNGGVIVAMAPDLLFLKDTDGDDKADVRVRLVSGLDTADTHHTSNSFTLDPAGALYFQEGTFHHTQVESPYGRARRCANAGVFRYEPRTQKFDVYVTHGFANPHGHVFDRWGQDFIYDGTGAVPYHGALFSGHMEFPSKHPSPPTVYKQRTRPCPGVEILSSRHFPDELQGNLLVGNVIGFQGILQYKVSDDGASFTAEEVQPIMSSTDENFRPTDIEIGPDGAIWFTEWQNPIIGHMQHNLRDPNRDRIHGRIFRVTHKNRPLLETVDMTKLSVDELLDQLKAPEDRVRCRARIELSSRDTAEVMKALDKWVDSLDSTDPNIEHHRLEALWLCGNHNVVNEELLKSSLVSPAFQARSAATKLLGYWGNRVPNAVELLKQQAADVHPRVRMEAIRAASFFAEPDAVQVPLIAAGYPSDKYIDYVRNETMKTLEPYWRKGLAEGKLEAKGNVDALRVLLKDVSTQDLLSAKPSRAVYLELLERPGIQDEIRQRALGALAEMQKRPRVQVLVDVIRSMDKQEAIRDESVLYDLGRMLSSFSYTDLEKVHSELQAMAMDSHHRLVSEQGFAALITADNNVEPAWQMAMKSPAALQDLVSATPFIRDIALRTSLMPRLESLLKGLPKELTMSDADSTGVHGRYVRIELKGRHTLTLAEVEVYSGGRNVARQGKASQKNTAHGGSADRGIDGNKSPIYGDGGQTHSSENAGSPWWEVDLGDDVPIESIEVYNRKEGKLGERLNGFSLIVLDKNRRATYRQDGIAAPDPQLTLQIGGGNPADAVRRAAMMALAKIPGQELRTFQDIVPFVKTDDDRSTAIRALLSIPAKYWPADDAAPLMESVLGYLQGLPAKDRTTPAALDAVQLGEALATLLPADQASAARKSLRELSVRIIRLATVPERMIYDKEILAVEAGKPVEIIFENTDLMPHNFVLARPGSLQEVGLAAEAMATQPDALEKNYIPRSDKILWSSRLLQPRDVQRLSIIAPSDPGVYPYVCTYPGHWRRMYGAMFVVKDLEAYQADASKYLADNPMEPKDEMLQLSRPRKEWKYEELAGALDHLKHGRSYNAGKQVFQTANCVACHKLNGVGYEIGPDLSKLDPKNGAPEILKSLLEPSDKIEKKYATSIFELESGKVVTGLVVESNDDEVKVVENPLAKADAIIIPRDEIYEQQTSTKSIMPVGLLDRLTREEVLDLIAYLVARGNANDAIFSDHHGH